MKRNTSFSNYFYHSSSPITYHLVKFIDKNVIYSYLSLTYQLENIFIPLYFFLSQNTIDIYVVMYPAKDTVYRYIFD